MDKEIERLIINNKVKNNNIIQMKYEYGKNNQIYNENKLKEISEKVVGKMRAKNFMKSNEEGIKKERMTEEPITMIEVTEEVKDESGSSSQNKIPPNNSNIGFEGAGKYLLSGGIAGAVSRTATAPFDRLKIYLITANPSHIDSHHSASQSKKWFSNLYKSLKLIYNEHSNCHLQVTQNQASSSSSILSSGSSTSSSILFLSNKFDEKKNLNHKWGIRNFFIGNGLNVFKVFPESAIKFFVYEYCKHLFDNNNNNNNKIKQEKGEQVGEGEGEYHRKNLSRFVAGGLAGVVSQVLIYPIETLKTQLMSSTINERFQGRALLIYTIKKLNKTGGIRGYYKGITVAALGVFPYSAIDMSAFEMLKKAYQTATGNHETGVIATLMCGAMSGGVGASIVYPLNVVRTRLQAQGTPHHPQNYSGVLDCIKRSYLLEGWLGFYRGLVPSLLKVIPAVSISWLVYEQCNTLLDSL